MLTGRLENGIKYAVKERKDINSVTVSVWIKTGARYERKEEKGIAHFLEHMLFNGSERFPPGAIDREVELMGGEINAATSYDYTYYYITVPYIYLERALFLLREIVLFPLLSDEMVEKEKPIVLEEIVRSKDNPFEVFAEKLMEKLYPDLPYRYPILGFEETVKKFNAFHLKEFYNRHYSPDKITVVVVGRLEGRKTVVELEKLWNVERKSSKREKFEDKGKVETLEGKFTFYHQAVEIPRIVLAWRLPPCGREDIYYEILNSLLSGGKSSIFFNEIVEKGTAYSCYSNYQNLQLSSNFTITASTEKVEETTRKIYEVLGKIKDIKEEEFLFAKEKLYKAELFARESGEVEADGIGYALGIMEDLGYSEEYLQDLEKASFEEFKNKVKFLWKRKPIIGIITKNGN